MAYYPHNYKSLYYKGEIIIKTILDDARPNVVL